MVVKVIVWEIVGVLIALVGAGAVEHNRECAGASILTLACIQL